MTAGEGALPPDLLGRLLNRVSRLQRQVLRLVASGFSTQEIADELCWSQRTVKSTPARRDEPVPAPEPVARGRVRPA